MPNTIQPSWNSSTNIFFQTIYRLEQKLQGRLHATWGLRSSKTMYPFEQKLDGRQQADRLHRKAEINPFRCQRGSSIEQPSWNSSNIIYQTMSSWAEAWWETPGKINYEWLEQFILDIKEGHALVIHLKILQTTYFVIIYSLQCSRLSVIVAIPGHTHLFFAEDHLVNEKVGFVMPQ